jgi:hypothetical protein
VRVLVVSLISAAVLAACASRPPAANEARAVRLIAAGDTFTLALGDAVRIGATPLRFESVAEDSRCPRDTACIWEGNARLIFVTGDGAGRKEVPLNTSSRFEQRSSFANGVLELRGVEPTPPIGDPQTYVATLHFEGGA